MYKVFFIVFLFLQVVVLGQANSVVSSKNKSFDFDIPWRAKSNAGVFDWFIDKLDPKCDTVVYNLFKNVGMNTDSIQWIYPTDILYDITTNGDGYYSVNHYFTDSESDKIEVKRLFVGKNKLPNKFYHLFYTSPDKEGKISFVLCEYF
jgi:hypothetical protein